jgi:hypothetical protein
MTETHDGPSPLTSEMMTLLVKSRARGKVILPRMFEGQRDCLHAAGDPCSYSVGDLPYLH